MLRRTFAPLLLTILAATSARADDPPIQAQGPAPHQVYQRDLFGNAASFPIRLSSPLPEGWKFRVITTARNPDGIIKIIGDMDSDRAALLPTPPPSPAIQTIEVPFIPTGGPYHLQLTLKKPDGSVHSEWPFGPFFVGDLWLLIGQSNMQGAGDLVDVTPPNDRVQLLGMDGHWTRAEEPLHWLSDSPDPVHSGDPATREARSKAEHRITVKGASLGLPFGVALTEATGVPIGLIAAAHGGTSMADWSPARKGEGGKSLYGSMLRQVALAGGKLRGALWYQGEGDANDSASPVFPKAFADFIAALRADVGQPDLPFDYVQIGRFLNAGNPNAWDAVREAQRLAAQTIPHSAVVPAIDLVLDDLIHVGTEGHKRLGRRLARVALHDTYTNPAGRTAIDFDRVTRGPDNTLRVRFKGVNLHNEGGKVLGLMPATRVLGFSIRNADTSLAPLVYEAKVDPHVPDTVILKLDAILAKEIPEGAQLWYGYGYDPACNLVDAEDMAAPAFGPIPLDDVRQ